MPDLVVLRLRPSKPMAPSDFTALISGLTITAFDLSFADGTSGVELGSASGVADPHLSSTTNNKVTITSTSIMQHYLDVTDFSGTSRHLESVATAIIVAAPPAGHHEYPTPTSYDLRLKLTNAGGASVVDDRLEFNVAVTTAGSLSTSQKGYFGMATSAYVTLPASGAALEPGVAFVQLPPNGQPPAFAELVTAIDLVLADDPSAPEGSLVAAAPLTAAQSQYVASEIVWNRTLYPPPEPDPALGGDPFGALYTRPPVDPTVSSDDVAKARPQFEADEGGYYGTHQAEALALAGYVFSAAAAIAQERLSIAAELARIDVALITGAATDTTAASAGVELVGTGGLTPQFIVAADVFYALAATLPVQISAAQRYNMARLTIESTLLIDLQTAIDAGVITLPAAPSTTAGPTITIDQAARRLAALGGIQTSLAQIPLAAPINALVGDWLAYAGPTTTIAASFWVPEAAARPDAYLQLVLEAITGDYLPLIAAITGPPYAVTTVAQLIALTDQQWRALFLNPLPPLPAPPRTALLPPWTMPGTPDQRAESFIRHLSTFFAVPQVFPAAPVPSADAPLSLPLSSDDVFATFLAGYPANSGGTAFAFTDPVDDAAVTATAADVMPGDVAAQEWLVQAVHAVAALWQVTAVGAGELQFSLMEALYARGFVSAGQIAALSPDDFAYALSGSVAYSWATALYAQAGGTGGPAAGDPGPFTPVNPAGSLVDCVPPPHLSPLGPVQYLHELLQVAPYSTCAEPLEPGDPAALGAQLAGRRGPLGQLLASAANLETPLPVIDLVNESLEQLTASVPGMVEGAVHDTSADAVAGHLLADDSGPGGTPWRHDPQTLFGVLPEYSSPASPVAVPGAYTVLRNDFTAPTLPYSEPLDLNRSYLGALRTTRFSTMRHFRRDITEFAVDAIDEPADFRRHQWRLPVRLDIAIEYLHISPQEYEQLYAHDLVDVATAGHQVLRELYGFAADSLDGVDWTVIVRRVPQFLARTGLTYCEFIELWRCGYVPFTRGRGFLTTQNGWQDDQLETQGGQLDGRVGPAGGQDGQGGQQGGQPIDFPECEPCTPGDLVIDFGDADVTDALHRLIVFIRLWRTLREVPCADLDICTLHDVCEVLGLFTGGTINPDFIRQLAAFVMLRELLGLPLHDPAQPVAPGAVGDARTTLLALWVGPSSAGWDWAVATLIERIQAAALAQERRLRRQPELTKLVLDNLDALSVLADFDPTTGSDTWHAHPTGTLRFTEVLLKIYISEFTVGEVLFLFADDHVDGDDPFALPGTNQSADDPLELPDDEERFGLWALRRRLLAVDNGEHDEFAADRWSWGRIVGVLTAEFGYDPAPGGDALTALGEHFFPSALEREGWSVPAANRRFSTPLAVADTSPAMWNTPPDGPFRYDAGSGSLSAQLPLHDAATAGKLSTLRALSAPERDAVQALYFAPRTLLARFGLIFADFARAAEVLVATGDEDERFAFFAAAFARFHRRCEVLCEHLAEHVGELAPQTHGGVGPAEVWRLLRELHGDENAATAPWESDSGAPPALTWLDAPTGGGFAALLSVLGTGLLGTVSTASIDPAWRDTSGQLSAFGRQRDEWNAPVPTIVPSLSLTLTDAQLELAAIRNGFALRDTDGRPLHGAEPFTVVWTGTLLVEEGGRYTFAAGSPTREGEEPGREDCPEHEWQVTLRRGQKSWQLLNRDRPGEPAPDFRSGPIELRRGGCELTVTLVHTQPDFAQEEQLEPRHTGFQLKYAGPDTGEELLTLPHHRLYREQVDAPLGTGLQVSAGPAEYLRARYTGSLRDVRRTYQRAVKAALLVHRFRLSARPLTGDSESELGYLLQRAEGFAGQSHYRTGATSFGTHQAGLAPDLLPVSDPYHTPDPATDQRTAPSPRRQAALFDSWERLFDYVRLRRETRSVGERPAWRLFYEAAEHQPDDPAELVRHLGIDVSHAPQVLTYLATPADYMLVTPDLETEAWAIRAWRAEQWLDERVRCFHPLDITAATPRRWAADDPSLALDAGNDNLTAFVLDAAIENGVPRRYDDVRVLDDGLRLRARDALVTWLCGMNRVPLPFAPGSFATHAGDLSDLLLQDVRCGVRERASRIEDAISAAQAFVQRARLGLEPGFVPTAAFTDLWDERFATFAQWRCDAERALYRENWVEWDDLRRARRVDAFRFLEERLRQSTLTVAHPGGLEWWPGGRLPVHPGLTAVQDAEWSQLTVLLPGPTPENLDLLGTPDRDAQPAWLAPFARPAQVIENNPNHGDQNGAEQNGNQGNDRPRIAAVAGAPASTRQPPPAGEIDRLPLWLQAAVRLGHRYLRVAAAGVPPASAGFTPCPPDGDRCCECGEHHEALVDEYYFWLQDGQQFADITQDADVGATTADATSDWDRPEKLPALLAVPTTPVVYLCWSRVRHGEFETPRRCAHPVVIDPVALPVGVLAQLDLAGRTGDSLRFTVSGGIIPTGYTDPAAPGFRYDLATDDAHALPLIVAPPAASTVLTDLPAYPYFAYVCPGSPVEPLSLFPVATTVAGALRANCRFEAALKWYELQWRPLASNDAWIGSPFSTSTTAVDDDQARQRAILLDYLDTVLDWADALISRNAPESVRRADVLIDTAARVLGAHPPTVRASGDETSRTVNDFVAAPGRLNPRLVALYARVDDRLANLHQLIDARRRRSGTPVVDMPYFGDQPDDCGCGGDGCAGGCEPYRFSVLVEKAIGFAGEARSLGAALLTAFEKGDAEYLAALRATQERQLQEMTIQIRQNQLRDADWQVQALAKSEEAAQSKLRYYQNLIAAGLIAGEIGYETLTGVSMGSRTAGNVSEAIAQGIGATPDFWIGVAGIAGTPLQFNQIPMGSKLAAGFSTAARILNALADIAGSGAQLSETLASWDRREADWRQQVDVTTIEIEQIRRQILGAQRRRDQARHDLDNTQRQVENSVAVQNFLRDRFSSHELYLYLQRETAALYHGAYQLARDAAAQAQRALNYELGHTRHRFVPDEPWDSLHEGLLAGDRLALAVRQMEKAYLDTNCREYELAKHVSLRLNFPLQFLQLQATGRTEIEIPEWIFDVDYPGQYLRRLRNVSLSIPCVVGPYTGVHCRLTLLSSRTRIDPTVVAPAVRCCDAVDSGDGCGCAVGQNGYDPAPDDPRVVRSYAATEGIATSSGQNDSGLFELSFRDERHLPFEFAGAVSRWRIELPPETNFFDLDTVSDLVMHLNYTAREGGEVLAAAAAASARCRLPGDGLRLLDVRRDLPNAWMQLSGRQDGQRPFRRGFDLIASEALFPYVPIRRVSSVASLQLLVEAPCAEPGSAHVVRFYPGGHHHGEYETCDCDRIDVTCVAGSDYEGLFRGEVDLSDCGPLGPLEGDDPRRLGCFEFDDAFGEICNAYLVLGYCADRARGCGAGRACPCGGRGDCSGGCGSRGDCGGRGDCRGGCGSRGDCGGSGRRDRRR